MCRTCLTEHDLFLYAQAILRTLAQGFPRRGRHWPHTANTEGPPVEHHRFDALTRTLAACLPRRGLGPLVGALVGLGLGEVDAKDRDNYKDGKNRNGSQGGRAKKRQGDHNHDQDQDRNGTDQGDHKDHGGGASAEAKKKTKCVDAGGSCKKPKKGRKPKKCCAGLSCDGATKKCTAPSPPPDERSSCGRGLQTCHAGCLPTDETCCPVGQRPCDGSCSGADSCRETEFSACMAPVAADWDAAVAACSGDCATPESDSCQACALDVLETFADPLLACMQTNCMGPGTGAGRAAAQSRQAAAAAEAVALRSCSPGDLRVCKALALIQTAASLGYEVPLAMLEGPLIAAATALLNSGKLSEDLRLCETQHGCPTGECDPQHGVCCGGTAACEFYDPGSATCKGCPKDTYCQLATGQCLTQCKRCDEYLVDGRAMPCGDLINNCGQFLTCAPCRADQRCLNRRCVSTCAAKTCQELGVPCGPADDGCGGSLDCGPCAIVGTVSVRLRTDFEDPDGSPGHGHANESLDTYVADYVAEVDGVRLRSTYHSVTKEQHTCYDTNGKPCELHPDHDHNLRLRRFARRGVRSPSRPADCSSCTSTTTPR